RSPAPTTRLLRVPGRRRQRYLFHSPKPESIRQGQSAHSPRLRRSVLFPDSFPTATSRNYGPSESRIERRSLASMVVVQRLPANFLPRTPERKWATRWLPVKVPL